MKYLFLDTNVFIHYEDFEEISWKEIVGADDICIIVCPQVIKEIDKIKDSERGKFQKKAKTISSKFGNYFLSSQSSKIKIKICKQPKDELFNGIDFSRNEGDDIILLSLIQYESPELDKYMISGDNNILIKAKELGINAIKMPDKYLLKESPSQKDTPAMNIKREPKPALCFKNGSDIIHIKRPEKIDIESIIDEQMAPFVKKYPIIKNINRYDILPYTIIHDQIQGFSDKECIDRYNEKVKKYLDAMRNYFTYNECYKACNAYMSPIEINLSNKGTAQSGDDVIFIYIPDEVMLYDKNSIKKSIIHIPNTPDEQIRFNAITGFQNGSEKTVYRWDLEKPINRLITEEESKLNHNLRLLLKFNPLYINALTAQNFTIKYTISDSKLLNIVKRELHVIFCD